jgi:hypothetical protein
MLSSERRCTGQDDLGLVRVILDSAQQLGIDEHLDGCRVCGVAVLRPERQEVAPKVVITASMGPAWERFRIGGTDGGRGPKRGIAFGDDQSAHLSSIVSDRRRRIDRHVEFGWTESR